MHYLANIGLGLATFGLIVIAARMIFPGYVSAELAQLASVIIGCGIVIFVALSQDDGQTKNDPSA